MSKLRRVRFGESDESLSRVQEYLVRFGYLSPEDMGEEFNGPKTSRALRVFQEFFRIDVTGDVDPPTIRSLEKERCALGDLKDEKPIESCRWPVDVKKLICEFGVPSTDLDSTAAFNGVRNAMSRWNGILFNLGIDLAFKERTDESEVHVSIEWVSTDSDVGLVGKPVAHADYPPDCSIVNPGRLPKPIHFDDGEHYWTRDQVSGEFHIESVALHEFGHILGLVHVPLVEPGSLMNPSLPPNFIHPGPTVLDLQRLAQLYRPRIISLNAQAASNFII